MKRMIALMAALLLALGVTAAAEISVPDRYGTLIELLEAGNFEAAQLEFDRIKAEATGEKPAPTPGFIPAKIGDTINVGSFSIELNALHVIDGREDHFDTNTIGGPQLGFGLAEGAHRVVMTGDITLKDDSVKLSNHAYGKLVVGEETFDCLEAYNSEGKYCLYFLIPNDLVPYLDSAVIQLYLKDNVRYGEYVDEGNYDVAYEISLAQ